MKQYTDESQTAKLIELGFKKPESIIDAWAHETDIDMEYVYEYSYSIGELIEMLGYDLYSIRYSGISWEVKGEQVVVTNKELIDSLYDMILILKEEGVI